MFVFLTTAFSVSSCGSETPPLAKFTPEKQTIEPTSTPEPFVIGECDPAAELIEINKSYHKGVGCGYTDLEYWCGGYCLWVPEGSQLKINITDSFSDLKLYVKRDLYDLPGLFEDQDTEAVWISDNVGRDQDESVTIENPAGRYYIMVCPKTGTSCMFHGDAVVFTSAALFKLTTEFEGLTSETTSSEEGSRPLVRTSSDQGVLVRTGPGDQYPPTEDQIPMESAAALVARTPDGNWLLVEFGSTQGWVPASEVNVYGEYSLVPIIQGTPAPTSTPEPCLKRIAEGIINDQVFEGLRTELNDLIKDAAEKKAEDLEPIIQHMEELLNEIEGYEFSTTYSSCTQRVHAAIYNYAWFSKEYFRIKHEEYVDGVSYADELDYQASRARYYEEEFDLLIYELEQIINPAPTIPLPVTPQKTSVFTNEIYDPNLEISKVEVTGNRIDLTICFDPPSDRADWMMGRLPDDLYLYDGTHTVILHGFTLASPYNKSGSSAQPRCYRTGSSIPYDFRIDQATLTVERIAATIGNKVDWDAVLEQIELVAPGIVIDPDLDQPGPGYGLLEYPPYMTAQEASHIVDGLFEPVYIGPWSIPIQADSE
jgi:hypothetical protein